MNGYDLSREWFDWCFENPDKIKPNHTALFFFAIEHCNRLGWKEKFGLPSQMAMDAIGIKNWRTYSSTFEDIVNWGFFKVYEKSKNQYSATVIAIVKNTKANTKALSKAMQKHVQKQSRSIVGINKPNNQEPLNQETIDSVFYFEKSLLSLGVEKQIASDWMKVRKNKRASNTETAFKNIVIEIQKSGLTANDCIKKSVENSWSGFKSEWLHNSSQKPTYSTNSNYTKSNNDVNSDWGMK